MTYNPWIAHDSPKAYFQWRLFEMETVKILAQKKEVQQPRILALSEI